MEISWKRTVSTEFWANHANSVESVCFYKIPTPGIRWNFGILRSLLSLTWSFNFILFKKYMFCFQVLFVRLIVDTATTYQTKLWFRCFWNVSLVLNHALVYCVHPSVLLYVMFYLANIIVFKYAITLITLYLWNFFLVLNFKTSTY